jgi:hypothetical protein
MPPSELVNDLLQGGPTRLEQHEHVTELTLERMAIR